MSGNRVEELEASMRRLQATVDGLTDELMETKERLYVLEEEIDPDLNMDVIEGRPAGTRQTQTDGSGATPGAGASTKGQATQRADRNAENEANSAESETNDDVDSTDDIIVA
jgi:hypothetical protein